MLYRLKICNLLLAGIAPHSPELLHRGPLQDLILQHQISSDAETMHAHHGRMHERTSDSQHQHHGNHFQHSWRIPRILTRSLTHTAHRTSTIWIVSQLLRVLEPFHFKRYSRFIFSSAFICSHSTMSAVFNVSTCTLHS